MTSFFCILLNSVIWFFTDDFIHYRFGKFDFFWNLKADDTEGETSMQHETIIAKITLDRHLISGFQLWKYSITWENLSLKSIRHKVVCLLLRNAHKMTRKAALNGCTESEPVLCAFLKSKQTPYDTSTLAIVFYVLSAIKVDPL